MGATIHAICVDFYLRNQLDVGLLSSKEGTDGFRALLHHKPQAVIHEHRQRQRIGGHGEIGRTESLLNMELPSGVEISASGVQLGFDSARNVVVMLKINEKSRDESNWRLRDPIEPRAKAVPMPCVGDILHKIGGERIHASTEEDAIRQVEQLSSSTPVQVELVRTKQFRTYVQERKGA